MENNLKTQLLVIGAGLAGERAAVSAAESGVDVTMISLVPPKRSHSSAAQGGMQAALANNFKNINDSKEIHFLDTVKGADWGCDQNVVRLFVEEAPGAVIELDNLGVPWTKIKADSKIKSADSENKGNIAARNFGATSLPRTCYASDGTGHSLMSVIDGLICKKNIKVYDRHEAVSLIIDNGKCCGAVIIDHREKSLKYISAKVVIIATGGFGRLYEKSTNGIICEGYGQFLVLNTGIGKLANMEAVQFHPTAIITNNILVTEACRGDGGRLLDKNLHRFMPDYEPEMKELASRDIVTRRMTQHIKKGFGVSSEYGDHLWLDIRHLGKKHISENLREVSEICLNFLDIDPSKDLVPVFPVQHYGMGGIRTDIDCHCKNYGIEGLFAAGEAACWGLHGFNRLGGNSLAETIIAGKIAGNKAAEYLKNEKVDYNMYAAEKELNFQKARIEKLKISGGKEKVFRIKNEMRKIMTDMAGVFRNKKTLEQGLKKLKNLYLKSENCSLSLKDNNFEIYEVLRLKGMLKVAICIVKGAFLREESRGAHFREDFPQRDDEKWLKRSLFQWREESDQEPIVSYEPVDISEIKPGSRK